MIASYYHTKILISFLYRQRSSRGFIYGAGKLTLTKLTISGGTKSNQTESESENFALLAKASATTLPSLGV